MNKTLKILIILFVIVLLILTGAYAYLRVKGKDLVVQRIEEQLGRKISFEAVSFSYPLTMDVKGLSIEGYGSAKQTLFSLSLPHLFLGQVHFTSIEIIEPYVLYTQGANEKVFCSTVSTQPQNTQKTGTAIKPAKVKGPGIALYARKVVIRNGILQVFQSLGSEAKALAYLEKINAEIDNVAFPMQRPVKTNLHLKAIVSGFGGRLASEALEITGWADFFQKDMLAQARLTGINGQVGLKADLASVKNDMTVKGTMSLSFKAKTAPEQGATNFEGLFVQALQSSGANVDLKFQFKTKMDDFKAEKISLSGAINDK
jgi:hypothetical protein